MLAFLLENVEGMSELWLLWEVSRISKEISFLLLYFLSGGVTVRKRIQENKGITEFVISAIKLSLSTLENIISFAQQRVCPLYFIETNNEELITQLDASTHISLLKRLDN